jgi:hypothetical protein
MSPEAIKQMFSPDGDSTLIVLLTVYDADGTTPLVRLADNFTSRISETADEVIYGVVSRGDPFTFLPLRIALPSEEKDGSSRCSIVLEDVTRYITPIIRSVTSPPKVKIELVLSKTPDVVEILFDGFYITNFQYNAQQVTAELMTPEQDREPFPAYSYTPQFNPGLF